MVSFIIIMMELVCFRVKMWEFVMVLDVVCRVGIILLMV